MCKQRFLLGDFSHYIEVLLEDDFDHERQFLTLDSINESVMLGVVTILFGYLEPLGVQVTLLNQIVLEFEIRWLDNDEGCYLALQLDQHLVCQHKSPIMFDLGKLSDCFLQFGLDLIDQVDVVLLFCGLA